MVATIADIPFLQTPPDELFGIDWGRPGFVDDDHTGFGFGVVPRLLLRSPTIETLLAAPRVPLVFALHSADRDPLTPADAPFDLELDIGDERIHVPLDRFLAVWLPRVTTAVNPTDLVLALCNPTGYALGRPPGLAASTRFWYATSDVDSFGQQDSTFSSKPAKRSRDDLTTWGLTAQQWVCLP